MRPALLFVCGLCILLVCVLAGQWLLFSGGPGPRPAADMPAARGAARAPGPDRTPRAPTNAVAAAAAAGALPCFDELRAGLLIAEGGECSSSAFIARMGGRRYVVTCAHVVKRSPRLRFVSVDGAPVAHGDLELSTGRDLARFALIGALPARVGLEPAASRASMNDPVVVYGNSQGEGLVTELRGRVIALGPERIEIDAPFVGGNSGSPILAENGRVIGVASRISRSADAEGVAESTRFEKARRFGARLDTPTEWRRVDPAALRRQADLLEDIGVCLADLYRVIGIYHAPRKDTWDYSSVRYTFLPLHRFWADFDPAEHRGRFHASAWGDLLDNLVQAHKKCRELEYWHRKIQQMHPLPRRYREDFKRIYGKDLDVEAFAETFRQFQDTRDRRMRAFITRPEESLLTTEWIANPCIMTDVYNYTNYLHVVEKHVTDVLESEEYRRSQI